MTSSQVKAFQLVRGAGRDIGRHSRSKSREAKSNFKHRAFENFVVESFLRRPASTRRPRTLLMLPQHHLLSLIPNRVERTIGRLREAIWTDFIPLKVDATEAGPRQMTLSE